MSYDLKWVVPGRVAHLHVYGQVSPREAHRAYDALMVLHEQGIAPIHLILEHTGLEKFPLTLNLYNFIIDGEPPVKGGWMLIVGNNRQARFIGMLFSYVTKLKSKAFDTQREAVCFLKDTDPSLASVHS